MRFYESLARTVMVAALALQCAGVLAQEGITKASIVIGPLVMFKTLFALSSAMI